MRAKIYHRYKVLHSEVPAIVNPKHYTYVATITTSRDDDLEEIYFLSNSVFDYWPGGDNVSDVTTKVKDIRSTSIGDLIYDIDAKMYYIVASCGFNEVTVMDEDMVLN